jgi:hypothetical protein
MSFVAVPSLTGRWFFLSRFHVFARKIHALWKRDDVAARARFVLEKLFI